MRTYNVYVSDNDFKVGSVVAFPAGTVQPGDTLSIVFLNDEIASGSIVSASPNEVEMQINLATWRLRPHAPSDSTVHGDRAGSDASFWTVQTRL